MAIISGIFEKMMESQTQQTGSVVLYKIKENQLILTPIGVAPLDIKTASGGNGTNLLVHQYWG